MTLEVAVRELLVMLDRAESHLSHAVADARIRDCPAGWDAGPCDCGYADLAEARAQVEALLSRDTDE